MADVLQEAVRYSDVRRRSRQSNGDNQRPMESPHIHFTAPRAIPYLSRIWVYPNDSQLLHAPLTRSHASCPAARFTATCSTLQTLARHSNDMGLCDMLAMVVEAHRTTHACKPLELELKRAVT